ncbi:MAG: hypothetical protein ACYCW6_27855 [Candidatus Xenobia bacterium]
MKRLTDLLKLGALAAMVGGVLFASAPAKAANYPSVSNLTPFTADCNYMSRAGYLRYLVYERDGIWLSRAEAVAIVNQQSPGAGE